MARIALIVGIIFAVTGLMAIAFGVPNKDFSVGSTAIVSGSMLLSGGLILAGLSAVVTELRRIGALLEDRKAPPPMVRSAPGIEVSAGITGTEPAIIAEMVREQSPRSRQREIPLPPVSPPPRLEADDASDITGLRGVRRDETETTRARRHDYPEPAEPSGHLFDSLWPARSDQPPPRRAHPSAPHETDDRIMTERAREPHLDAATRSNVTVIKSGIVDGMAYTLFSDGSIEAELANGPVRFASINELRAHLEGRG